MALAVVMIFQAIDHLNFAQGEMAMFSTFIAWQAMAWGFPYWLAFLFSVSVSFIRRRPDRAGPVPADPPRTGTVEPRRVSSRLFSIFNSGAGYFWDFTIKSFPEPLRPQIAVRQWADGHP